MSNLTIEVVLAGLAEALRTKILPALAHDPFATEQARLSAGLLAIAAGQVDGLAAVRAAENAAMRALFADAAGLVPDPLGARLAEAAGGIEPDLRVAALDGEGGRLRVLLVDLHAALEDEDADAARAMHQRIWRLLRDMEAARG